MTVKNKTKSQVLTYKGKPLLRKGNMLYFGEPDGKYIITMKVQRFETIKDVQVSTRVSIELQHNNTSLRGRDKVIKKAEREGLYRALDIANVWLDDAISSENK